MAKSQRRALNPAAAESEPKTTTSIRLTSSLRDRLEAASARNDQSLSREVEGRLEWSFNNEGERALTSATLRNPQLTGLVSLLFFAASRALEGAAGHASPESAPLARDWFRTRTHWLANAYAYDQMVQAAVAVLELFRPKSDPSISSAGIAPANEEEAEYFRRFGAAGAYNLVSELKSPTDQHKSAVLQKLRQDIGELIGQATLDASVGEFIERIEPKLDPVPAPTGTKQADARTSKAGRSLIDAAKRRGSAKERNR